MNRNPLQLRQSNHSWANAFTQYLVAATGLLLLVVVTAGAARAQPSANSAPTISDIPNQTTDEDVPIGPLSFTIGDAETAAGDLTLFADSSNSDLVPIDNIDFGGSGSARTVNITPAAEQPLNKQSDSSIITIIVSDGNDTAQDTFRLTVNPVDDPPTISSLADQEVEAGKSTGPIAFTIDDVDDDVSTLSVSATSGNTTLVPSGNIVLSSGSGSARSVDITAATGLTGTTTITLTVSDNTSSVDSAFTLTVIPANQPPQLFGLSDQQTDEDTPITVDFVVTDPETASADLALTITASNPTLVPNANIAKGGSDADRTVTLTPAENLWGTTTISVTVSDGELSATKSFALAVNAVDDAPVLNDIPGQTTQEDTPITIPFTIEDIDTPEDQLSVQSSSLNPTLVPNGNIQVAGSGITHTVTITPAANQFGKSAILISIYGGSLDPTVDSFLLTVESVNDAPTIAPIADQSTQEDTPFGPFDFFISDVESDASSLTVSARASNTGVISDTDILLAGTGVTRTLTLTPKENQSGSLSISLFVNDGENVGVGTFNFTVNAVNDPPQIDDIGDQATQEDTPKEILFTANDVETPTSQLDFSVATDNPTLLPIANVSFSPSGSTTRMVLTPADNLAGSVIVAVTVSDGRLSASDSFTLTVGAVDDAPTVSMIPNQSTTESVPKTVSFTIGDVDTDLAALALSATSSNQALVPDTNVVIDGDGAEKTLTLTPQPGAFGTTDITLSVSDDTTSTSRQFRLAVKAIPTLSDIGDQTSAEDTVATTHFIVGDSDTSLDNLLLSAVSSNPSLLPSRNISFDGTGTDRTLMAAPGADLSGTTTITVTVSDGSLSASDAFRLTVTAVNDAPTLTTIDDQLINQNDTASAPFTMADVDNPLTELTLSGNSSNDSVVPSDNVTFAGSGAERSVTVVPAANAIGSATIRVTASDGQDSTSTEFLLTINAPPSFGTIADLEMAEDTSETIEFSVSDADSDPENLTLSATSSDPTLIRDDALILAGSGANRTLTIQPEANHSGSATITLTAQDILTSTSTTFAVTIDPVDDAPTISAIDDQSGEEDGQSGPVSIKIADTDTDVNDLELFGSSSNTALVPHTNIVFGGSGANRTVTVTPLPDLYGSATITVTVSDGSLIASTAFTLTILPVNDAPRLAAIPDQEMVEDTDLAVSITVEDIDSDLANVTLSGSSSNQMLLPDANIVFGGSGSERTLTLTPMSNQAGTATLTIVASDGSLTSSQSFVLTVKGGNDAPVIAPIGDQEMTEDTPYELDILFSDIDTPPEALAISLLSSNPELIPDTNLSLNKGNEGKHTLTIVPAPDRTGAAVLTLIVSDGEFTTSSSFKVTVLPVNDAPMAVDDTLTVITSKEISIGVLANDSDIDNDPLDVIQVTQGAYGSVTINQDNTVRYQMVPDFVGSDSFVYTVSDGHGGKASAKVVIDVIEPPGPNTPLAYSVQPKRGENDRATTIDIVGLNFAETATLTLGPYPLPDRTLVDTDHFVASVPAFLPPGTYDLVVTNPDGRAAILPAAFTVDAAAIAAISVRPDRGRVDLATPLNVYGLNFSDKAVILLDEAPLETTYLSETHLQTTIPADWADLGLHAITVQNPDGTQDTLADAYTVFQEDNDDLFGYAYEFWTEPATLHTGQSVQLGLRVHRQAGADGLMDVPVAFYKAAPQVDDAYIGSGTVPLLLPGDSDSTAPTIWTPPAPGSYTLYAVIDPDNQIAENNEHNNIIVRTVTVFPTEVDMDAPRIDEFHIDDGAASAIKRDLTLSVRASDARNDIHSIFFVEYEYIRGTDQWVPVQESGWLDYTGTPTAYTWRLLPSPGIKYIQAWAADAVGNILSHPALAGINYVPPGDNVVSQNQVRLYRYFLRAGEQLSVFLMPREGDPDLYVWPPDHETRPPWITNLGSGVDEIGFVAPVDGEYQAEISGYTSAIYQWVAEIRGIHPQGRAASNSNIDPGKPRRTLPLVPVADRPVERYALPTAPVAEKSNSAPTPKPDPSGSQHDLFLPVLLR